MLVVSGDWHGDWKAVIGEIKRLDLRDCTLIQVGDFGMGFDPIKKDLATLKYLNTTLKPRNIQLYAIRGNHDNPTYFDGSIKTSNIKLLPDYSVLTIDGLNVLCVGGAISIDRKPNPAEFDYRGRPWKGRKEGVNYWPNETFVLKPELLKDLKNIDIVVTHSAPDFCEPRTKHGLSTWIKADPGLADECMKERNDHSKMYDILKANDCPLKYWFYGHFHYYKREEFENTECVLIDINQFYEVRI
jgi:DNA repair exonuclease SbcCD nuclease subunit